VAKAPEPKGPGQGGKSPGNAYQRPKPKASVLASKRPAPAPNVAGPRGAGKDSFVPGKVIYPGQVSKAKAAPVSKNSKHPAYHANRPHPRQLNQVISNTNVSSSRVNNNWGNQWTNNNTTVWNNNRTVFNRPVVISPNFQRSVNYAYRPTSWGARPWWSNSSYHTWHQGSWNYGWNRNWYSYHSYRPYYGHSINYFPGYHPYRSSYLAGLAWGLGAWTLGSLYYDTGYNIYRNPYHAPPVRTRTTVINYSQPISVVASRIEPEPEAAALTSEEMSTAAIERARAEFQNGDYLAALKSTDESISYASGDSALHEFRALCLFALGRYGDAAGVLNPVLASGPGWDWATMAAFYGNGDVYTGQLRKLEAYVEGSPDAADAHFLLGYHYLVAGFIDESYGMFDRVVTLQPADTVALQLRNLAESSSPNAAGETPEAEGLTASPEPVVTSEVIDPTDIAGGWNATSGDGKTITLTLANDGTFTWNYEGSSDAKVLSGDWSVDEEGRLVLASVDVQMVADISLEGNLLRFILAGSPVGDPGLSFQRL
jgi:tetratricopeptide (TPR) repeat protein